MDDDVREVLDALAWECKQVYWGFDENGMVECRGNFCDHYRAMECQGTLIADVGECDCKCHRGAR